MVKYDFLKLYFTLHKEYGSQGWWPLSTIKTNNGYHPNNYKYPKTNQERFEICVGAILTQNTYKHILFD